ncbi:MAG TPA: putative Ig domain-containing protein [Anaeromyxobacter sp.]|nr:putative Ig domain-containing protein [Anaeromyxobacter sp.]
MLRFERPARSLVTVVAALLVGCGGSADPGPLPDPPEGLSYSVEIATYTVGVPIAPNTPTLSQGAATSFSIAPPLPAGLTLHPTTGVIGGTPAAITATTGYTVTARNSMGETTATLAIAVNSAPPSGLAYATNPASYPRGAAIAPNVPTGSGGDVAQYTVSPPLPSGLTLHPTTGVISGTPTAVTATASYVVTASNPHGSTQASLVLTIRAAPPTDLAYAVNPAIYPFNATITPNTPTHGGGAATSWTASPPLPAGLVLNSSTGVISGKPTSRTAAADYTITATNQDGSTQVVLRIAVPYGVSPVANMTTARIHHTATLLGDGTVLVAGGWAGTGSASTTASAELYHPDTRTFSNRFGSTTLTMRGARANHTAIRLSSGRVLLVGGQDSSSAELYDPATGTFTITGAMPGPRHGHSATLLPNGKVLIAGGWGSSSSLDTALLYDPTSGTFAATGQMTRRRYFHVAALLSNGRVLLAGGDSSTPASAELYDPATGTFTATASMNVPHSGGSALALSGGKVLVVNSTAPDAAGTVAEIYDPAVPAFTRPTNGGWADGAAALLLDGKVLVAGGSQVLEACSAPEGAGVALFDPAAGASGTWSTAGRMSSSRVSPRATTLANGDVLITGGGWTEAYYDDCPWLVRALPGADLFEH